MRRFWIPVKEWRKMVVLAAVLSSPMRAQTRRIRVISSDSTPVVHAYVQLERGFGQITDEKGEVSIGAGKFDINDLVDANDVAGIEVYTRGGNTPISLQVQDTACGVIAIWTGSRKP